MAKPTKTVTADQADHQAKVTMPKQKNSGIVIADASFLMDLFKAQQMMNHDPKAQSVPDVKELIKVMMGDDKRTLVIPKKVFNELSVTEIGHLDIDRSNPDELDVRTDVHPSFFHYEDTLLFHNFIQELKQEGRVETFKNIPEFEQAGGFDNKLAGNMAIVDTSSRLMEHDDGIRRFSSPRNAAIEGEMSFGAYVRSRKQAGDCAIQKLFDAYLDHFSEKTETGIRKRPVQCPAISIACTDGGVLYDIARKSRNRNVHYQPKFMGAIPYVWALHQTQPDVLDHKSAVVITDKIEEGMPDHWVKKIKADMEGQVKRIKSVARWLDATQRPPEVESQRAVG